MAAGAERLGADTGAQMRWPHTCVKPTGRASQKLRCSVCKLKIERKSKLVTRYT